MNLTEEQVAMMRSDPILMYLEFQLAKIGSEVYDFLEGGQAKLAELLNSREYCDFGFRLIHDLVPYLCAQADSMKLKFEANLTKTLLEEAPAGTFQIIFFSF